MIGGTGSLEVVGFHRNMIQTMKVIGRLFSTPLECLIVEATGHSRRPSCALELSD